MQYNIITEVLHDGQKVTAIKLLNCQKDGIKNIKIHACHYDEDELIYDIDTNILSMENVDNDVLVKIEPIFLIQWHPEISTNKALKPIYSVYVNDKEVLFHKRINLLVDEFIKGCAHEINYRLYMPKRDDFKHPLIIWIHGAGEGGLSNETQITGNEGGVAFAREQNQKLFNGAYVLAPQSSSFWMENFDIGTEILKGKDQTKELIALIKDIIKNYSIDEDRIYIGGCSMGGYETFKVIIEDPSLFAFAFPICAAYKPTLRELEKIKNIPIWMTHAKADDSVPYSDSLETYNNLKKLNANVHLSTFDEVIVDGIHYLNHFSWIYALNNMCIDEDGNEFMEYMSKFSKQK